MKVRGRGPILIIVSMVLKLIAIQKNVSKRINDTVMLSQILRYGTFNKMFVMLE